MDERRKLFLKKDPYAPPKDEALFLRSVKRLAAHHIAHCPDYALNLDGIRRGRRREHADVHGPR